VLEAAAACRALLGAAADRDWARRIPEMDWTVAEAVGHLAETILRTVGAFATVLARVVDAIPPGARGWHPMGQADASGFAAMACDELLVHSDDAARGLGVPFAPPDGLVRATLTRLFPWAPDADPWPCAGATAAPPSPACPARTAGPGTAPPSTSGTATTRPTALTRPAADPTAAGVGGGG
jgi:hypothetical protein